MDDVLAQWETIRRARHKVLFFSSFEKHLRLYRAVLEAQGIAFVWLTGEVSASERAVAVTRFQEEPGIQAFFMTLKAGGVGLNLTAADYVFLLDPWWNPAAESQAVARAHRIGQQHPVTALRFIARDTVEEKILVLQEKKRLLGQALFDTGADTPLLTEAEITELLE
jgi:non-specific serine/threonine protein kinase